MATSTDSSWIYNSSSYPETFTQQDIDAAALVIERLKLVPRFSDGMMYDNQTFPNPTGEHAENVLKLCRTVFLEAGLENSPLMREVNAGILVHDNGEAIEEPASFGKMLREAGGETHYMDTGAYERMVAAYAIGMAYQEIETNQPGLLAQHMATMFQLLEENRALPEDQQTNPQALIDDYMHGLPLPSHVILPEEINTFRQLPADYQEAAHDGLALWMAYYDDIEQKRNFAGTLGKTLEKLEGQQQFLRYAGKGNAQADIPQRNSAGLLSSTLRIEGSLAKLFAQATTPEEIKLAQITATKTYEAVIEYFERGQYAVDLAENNTRPHEQKEPHDLAPEEDKRATYRQHAASVGEHVYRAPTTPTLNDNLMHSIRTTYDTMVLYKAAQRAVLDGTWEPDANHSLLAASAVPAALLDYVEVIEEEINQYGLAQAKGDQTVLASISEEQKTFMQQLANARNQEDTLLFGLLSEEDAAFKAHHEADLARTG